MFYRSVSFPKAGEEKGAINLLAEEGISDNNKKIVFFYFSKFINNL